MVGAPRASLHYLQYSARLVQRKHGCRRFGAHARGVKWRVLDSTVHAHALLSRQGVSQSSWCLTYRCFTFRGTTGEGRAAGALCPAYAAIRVGNLGTPVRPAAALCFIRTRRHLRRAPLPSSPAALPRMDERGASRSLRLSVCPHRTALGAVADSPNTVSSMVMGRRGAAIATTMKLEPGRGSPRCLPLVSTADPLTGPLRHLIHSHVKGCHILSCGKG
jgi:hypothetical protein